MLRLVDNYSLSSVVALHSCSLLGRGYCCEESSPPTMALTPCRLPSSPFPYAYVTDSLVGCTWATPMICGQARAAVQSGYRVAPPPLLRPEKHHSPHTIEFSRLFEPTQQVFTCTDSFAFFFGGPHDRRLTRRLRSRTPESAIQHAFIRPSALRANPRPRPGPRTASSIRRLCDHGIGTIVSRYDHLKAYPTKTWRGPDGG